MYETEAERTAFFKPLVQYRYERILGGGAFGVAILAFHEIERMGQGARLGFEDRDAGAPAGPEIQPRAVMVTPAFALVYNLVRRARGFQHIAERSEGFRGQRFATDPGHSPTPSFTGRFTSL